MHAAAFPTEAEARLVDALRKAGRASLSFVAQEGGQVVGHVLFSPVEGDEGRGLGLAPVAVLPGWQRRGIGRALVAAGIEACRRAGHGFVVVLGHPDYYARFGFRRALDCGLGNEYGAQDEFMVLELRPGALAAVRGVIKYGEEFSQLA